MFGVKPNSVLLSSTFVQSGNTLRLTIIIQYNEFFKTYHSFSDRVIHRFSDTNNCANILKKWKGEKAENSGFLYSVFYSKVSNFPSWPAVKNSERKNLLFGQLISSKTFARLGV